MIREARALLRPWLGAPCSEVVMSPYREAGCFIARVDYGTPGE